MPSKLFHPFTVAIAVGALYVSAACFGALRGTRASSLGPIIALNLINVVYFFFYYYDLRYLKTKAKAESTAAIRQHQPWQFRLSTALFFVTTLGIWFAVVANSAHRQQRAVQEIQQLNGTVIYSNQGYTPREWLKIFLPQDYALTVIEVRFDKLSIDDNGLAVVAALPELTSLDLSETKITDKGIAHLEGLTGLTTLNLKGTRLTDKGLAHLQGLTRLNYLTLDGTACSSDGLKYLKNMNQLIVLSLAFTKVGDEGLEVFRNMPFLSNLALGATRISDVGLVEVKGLKKLFALFICGTQVTPAGLAELNNMPNLTQLSVSRELVGPEGIRQLQQFRTLKALYFGGTDDPATASELKRAMPALTVMGINKYTIN